MAALRGADLSQPLFLPDSQRKSPSRTVLQPLQPDISNIDLTEAFNLKPDQPVFAELRGDRRQSAPTLRWPLTICVMVLPRAIMCS